MKCLKHYGVQPIAVERNKRYTACFSLLLVRTSRKPYADLMPRVMIGNYYCRQQGGIDGDIFSCIRILDWAVRTYHLILSTKTASLLSGSKGNQPNNLKIFEIKPMSSIKDKVSGKLDRQHTELL